MRRSDDLLRQLSSSIDQVADDAIYYGECESNFLQKRIPRRKGT